MASPETSQPESPSDVSYCQFSVDGKDVEVQLTSPCSCCKQNCFKGYFWAVIGALCFFVIFPAGVLLIIHGHYKGIVLTLCLGVLVLVVCICIIPGAYIGVRHWRRQQLKQKRLRRAAQNAVKEHAAFANDSILIDQQETASVVNA